MDRTLTALVADEVARALPEVVAFRRELHEHPELSLMESETARRIAERLGSLAGIEVRKGVGGHGVVGLLRGSSAGPTIALRADMDALPILERGSSAWKSRNPEVMHACGHDGHIAGLWGAAVVLSRLRDRIAGNVKFIFQPAEEGGAGALAMCEQGVLENPVVEAIFGLHGDPQAPLGSFGWKIGPVMAFADRFDIVVKGRGTHAAWPQLGIDPIVAGAQIVGALQTLVSRGIDPFEPVVCSVCQFHAGSAVNVIPESAEISGTLRSLDTRLRDRCVARMREIVENTARACGASAEFLFHPGYPATVNEAVSTRYAADVACLVAGDAAVIEVERPRMGGEDFAYYLQRVPGSFLFVGLDDGREGGYPSLHHPEFDFNDAVFPVWLSWWVHLAMGYQGGRKGAGEPGFSHAAPATI